MVKFCDSAFALPINVIFCNYLSQGGFREIWKCKNVVPAYKKNEKKHRPISLLPTFGKIVEKLTFDSMYSHLTNTNLLSPN